MTNSPLIATILLSVAYLFPFLRAIALALAALVAALWPYCFVLKHVKASLYSPPNAIYHMAMGLLLELAKTAV